MCLIFAVGVLGLSTLAVVAVVLLIRWFKLRDDGSKSGNSVSPELEEVGGKSNSATFSLTNSSLSIDKKAKCGQ